MSHASIVFIDDGISGHERKLDAIAASAIQQADLKNSGLTSNQDKCDWIPRQLGEWLGFIIDTVNMRFQVPESKIKKCKLLIDQMISSRTVTYRQMAKLAGFISSLYIAVGPAACTHIYSPYALHYHTKNGLGIDL